MANVLVFEASQSMDKVNSCRYALLKYLEVYNLKPPGGIGVFIYTDQPAFFESFMPYFHGFSIKEISLTEIKGWQDAYGFNGLIKPTIIKEVMDHIEGGLLYLDPSIYIKAPVEAVFHDLEEGYFYLQPGSGMASEQKTDWEKWKKSTGSSQLAPGQVWKTGVVGINSRYRQVVDRILTQIGDLHQQIRMPALEQLAFSQGFQEAGTVRTDGELFRNYGNLKEFPSLLSQFFRKNEEESIPNLVKLIRHLDASDIERQKELYRALPFYKKWLRMFRGKHWNIKQYQKKF